MKVVLIGPNPILNKGLSLFLRKHKSVELVKSFTEFEYFLLSYSNTMAQLFNVFILNISCVNSKQGMDYLRILDSMVESGHIIVIYEKSEPSFSTSPLNKNKIIPLKIENNLKKFDSIIKSIQAPKR